MQRFQGEWYLRANVGYLRTCTRCPRLGFWKVHQARPLATADRLLRLCPLLHLRPLRSTASTVRLYQVFNYIDDVSFLFSFFSEVNLMIGYWLIYQTYHELFVNYNFLVLVWI
jgi:hypothetical protein